MTRGPQLKPGTRPDASALARSDEPAVLPKGGPPPRVVVYGIEPDVDGGRYAVKRVVGDTVEATATIFAEGHDHLAARLRVRRGGDGVWRDVPMVAWENDRWRASFVLDLPGAWELTIEAWVDPFASWRWGLERKLTAGQAVSSELAEGALLVGAAAKRAGRHADAAWLAERAACLAGTGTAAERGRLALDPELAERQGRHPDRTGAATLDHVVRIEAERERAAFGAWYECFPRSCAPEPGRHGTLRDVVAHLRYVARMGFDVLYLPPIHPIGTTHRKGRGNALDPGPDDPGSPWAIGAPDGGHTAVHPALGTLADVDGLVAEARRLGIEVALDLAFQCSPDHPYVTAHPEWFRRRPDGSIQYAENPPKRYQDIYPFDFEGSAWRELWTELRDVVLFWVARGITTFVSTIRTRSPSPSGNG